MSTKDTNPKDAIGSKKPSLTVLPMPALYEVAAAFMEGAAKYRRHNWREAGIRTSVYVDAAFRHLTSFWEGEDTDPDSGLSHVSKAIAGLMILRDAMMRDNVTDDRPPVSDVDWMVDAKDDLDGIMKRYPNPLPPYTELRLFDQDGGVDVTDYVDGPITVEVDPVVDYKGRPLLDEHGNLIAYPPEES